MGWVLMIVAALFFFLAAVGSALIPAPMAWGLFFLALGLAIGGSLPPFWVRQ